LGGCPANSLQQIEDQIKNRLSYETDGLSPATTIKNITIISHGGPGYVAFGTDPGSPWLVIKGVKLDDPNSDASKLISMLSKYIAKDGTLDLAACQDGLGNNGDVLQAALERAFAKNGRSDVKVILHKRFTYVGYSGPYEMDK